MVLQFEGIYQTAKIFINDREAASVYYGYSTTELRLDEYLQYGTANVIRIEVDNQNQPNSRWYSGAGIYRPVWLYELEPQGLDIYDIRIKTISYEPAQIEVNVLCENKGAFITILDGEKRVGAESELIRDQLAYINIDICGENGIVESNADTRIDIAVEGGTLLAFGSADPRTEESFLTGSYTTYYGRSQAVVLIGREKELNITVHSGLGELKKIFPIKPE